MGSPFSRDERDGAEGAGQQGHVLEDSQGRSNVLFLGFYTVHFITGPSASLYIGHYTILKLYHIYSLISLYAKPPKSINKPTIRAYLTYLSYMSCLYFV